MATEPQPRHSNVRTELLKRVRAQEDEKRHRHPALNQTNPLAPITPTPAQILRQMHGESSIHSSSSTPAQRRRERRARYDEVLKTRDIPEAGRKKRKNNGRGKFKND